jgi:hypothetical protein
VILARWVAKLVARLIATRSNPDIYQKNKMGDINKGVANKKYTKKNLKKDIVLA